MYIIPYIVLIIIFILFCIKGNLIAVNITCAVLTAIIFVQIVYNISFAEFYESTAEINERAQ